MNTGVSYLLDYVKDIYEMVDLSAPVSIFNPNFMYLAVPLGVPYLKQNVPLLISYNIITVLVF